jgi:hypothetical protein
MQPHLDTVLTGPSLRCGRIYFSMEDADFFQVDKLSERSSKAGGVCVEIHVGDQTHATDIRFLSSRRIGPRKSFQNWFRAINAREGATLRLTRIGYRRFNLEYLEYLG